MLKAPAVFPVFVTGLVLLLWCLADIETSFGSQVLRAKVTTPYCSQSRGGGLLSLNICLSFGRRSPVFVHGSVSRSNVRATNSPCGCAFAPGQHRSHGSTAPWQQFVGLKLHVLLEEPLKIHSATRRSFQILSSKYVFGCASSLGCT